MNNFFDLINNPMMKTDQVVRYSGTHQSTPELLSTHIVDVQYISLIISRKLISFGEIIDIENLLLRGLIHDIDEVLIGDIPRLTKYSSSECHDALNAAADYVAKDISNRLDSTDYIYDIWRTAKDNTIEGYIMKLADMLSVAKKTATEISILNNNTFLKVAVEMSNYINDLCESVPVDLFYHPVSISYVKKLLRDVAEYLNSVLSERSDIVNDFKVKDSAVEFIISNRYKE